MSFDANESLGSVHKLLKYLMTVILTVLLSICIDSAIDDVKTDVTLFYGTYLSYEGGMVKLGSFGGSGFYRLSSEG